MNKFGRTAYEKFISWLPSTSPKRIPWDQLADDERQIWESVAETVINANVQEALRISVGKLGGGRNFASDRPGIPADTELHAADPMAREHIKVLQDRIGRLETIILNNYRNSKQEEAKPEPIEAIFPVRFDGETVSKALELISKTGWTDEAISRFLSIPDGYIKRAREALVKGAKV